jgi:ATP-binding cassette subfamily B protein
MRNIFRQLGKHLPACLLIAALLVVQAWCDLSLPGYTSDIVDVGIQQGGVTSAAPDTVRSATLQSLELMMPEDDAATVESAYGPANGDGVRSLLAGADRSAVEKALTTPDVAVYMAAAQNAAKRLGKKTAAPETQDLDAVNAAFAQMAGKVTYAEIQSRLGTAMSKVDQTTLDTIAKQAVLLVQLDYEAQGIAHSVQMTYLWHIGALMLEFSLLMVAVAVLAGLLASRVAAVIGRDLRRDVFRRVVGFSNTELNKFSTASLITRTTNDIQQVQLTSVVLLRMVAYAPILAVGGIIQVVRTQTGLSWIIAVAVATLIAVVAMLMRFALPKFKIMQTLVDRLNLVSREILTGIMPIRAFSREKYEEQRFDKANTDLMRTQLFTNRVMTFMMPAMMLIMNGVTLLIVWFGGKAMDAGSMQVGQLIAFITYTMQIVMSFLMLTFVSIMLPRAGVAADRICEVLHTESSIRDPEQPTEKSGWQGVVRFDNVSFRYPGADADVLEHISFTARPGQTTAVIGSTGCGKSTLLNLIPRFYDVTEGSVSIDGVDVRDMTQHQLHERMGYVPQQGTLFSGTIASNLKFGGGEITDEQMRQAAEIAQAGEFIAAKPDGYDSPIAQSGSNVSGGQRQRLSIARAVAKNPEIYLFDDSFSALDYKTDVALRRALAARTEQATVIIVAQRISTVLQADQILVLDEGRIVGSGTHAQLMASCSEYQEIARSQLSQSELEGGAQV